MEEITYLIANYNNGKYITDCLNSLHQQSSPNWRAIIVDDQSTDNSLQIINSQLTEKIKFLKNEQNIGYTPTLIRLIEQATTDIVGILDPDDALYPEATELVLQAYCEYPEAGFVYTNQDYYNEELTAKIGSYLSSAIPSGRTSLMHGVGAMRTFRRSAYAKTTGLDPSILYAEDRDLVYKMEEVTPFVFVDLALYKYRYVPNSQSHNPQKRRLGDKNHRRAYRNALARRQITGRLDTPRSKDAGILRSTTRLAEPGRNQEQ
ncbi:hypothetical protein BJP34_10345 [Moorena producens PAL-8-15-08-1]|uniref:Glycosyltransferase 2-like domain-containing protein n=1 Tax=Moorena producens PAL-8-15-08-1 TaxID=1458985 RepID=A0A1D8TQ52_9CYAN|nr:glycosyltransferase family 2 protein [Moorena producens]AOW99800.1 hypothetical protein BJP34_10345 [Moorena producens PAL-8-15-08-1]